jgi:hypothetical protein
MTTILALDLGKFKSVCCWYEVGSAAGVLPTRCPTLVVTGPSNGTVILVHSYLANPFEVSHDGRHVQLGPQAAAREGQAFSDGYGGQRAVGAHHPGQPKPRPPASRPDRRRRRHDPGMGDPKGPAPGGIAPPRGGAGAPRPGHQAGRVAPVEGRKNSCDGMGELLFSCSGQPQGGADTICGSPPVVLRTPVLKRGCR